MIDVSVKITEKAIHTFYVQQKINNFLNEKIREGRIKGRVLDYYLYVVSKINTTTFTHNDVEWVRLSSTALQKVMNWRNHMHVMDNLIGWKIIERSKGYYTGKCYGYRVNEAFQDKCISIKSSIKLKFVVAFSEKDSSPWDNNNNLDSIAHQFANLQRLSINENLALAQVEIWFEKFLRHESPITITHDTHITDPVASLCPMGGDRAGSISLLGYITPYKGDNSNISDDNNSYNYNIIGKGLPQSITPYVTTEKGLFMKVKEDTNEGMEMDEYGYHQYNFDRWFISSLVSRRLTFTRDKQGRLYTNLTNCPRRLRKFLIVDGNKRLRIVDVSNSQPLLVNILLEKAGLAHKLDVIEFKQVTEGGRLYTVLLDKLGLPQDQLTKTAFKEQFFKNVFYSKRAYPCKEVDAFRGIFPSVWAFVRGYKNTTRSTELSKEMQRAESEIVINGISPRLNQEGIWHLTIHDAVLCNETTAPRVIEVMKEEFNKKGLSPTVKNEHI